VLDAARPARRQAARGVDGARHVHQLVADDLALDSGAPKVWRWRAQSSASSKQTWA
jgi:hypothetical protein